MWPFCLGSSIKRLIRRSVMIFFCPSKRESLGVSSQCCSGAASLFRRPGQTSVIPEYDLKNVTISSDGPYMHYKKMKKSGKRAFGFTGSAILPGLCQRENTILSWKMLTFISEWASPANSRCEPPRREEEENRPASGRNESPALLTHLRNIKCTVCLPACALMNPRGAATCV